MRVGVTESESDYEIKQIIASKILMITKSFEEQGELLKKKQII